MSEFVGVLDPLIIGDNKGLYLSPLKQSLFIFDRIAIPHLASAFLAEEAQDIPPESKEELRWLVDMGLLFEPTVEAKNELTSQEFEEENEAFIRHTLGMIGVMVGLDPEKMFQITEENDDDNLSITADDLRDMGEKLKRVAALLRKKGSDILESPAFKIQVGLMTGHLTRMSSIILREAQGLDAYPVLSSTIPIARNSHAVKSDIFHIVLNSLPIPDDSTPWEQILEFRSDPNSRSKFLDLRNWMSEVARAELKPNEVVEKLEYLMSQYQRHMELHRIKTDVGTLQTIVVTGAEVLGDLFSFKWGKAAEALFSLKKRNIALLEGELTAPGSEVAYIVKARETF
jgi:hypothetical protein